MKNNNKNMKNMKNTVFPIGKQDILNQNMFLGDPISVSRNDLPKHKIFDHLTETQMSYFWRPEEVKLTEERKQFKELSEVEQHIFISNLKYQTLLDSIQSRAPVSTFLEICSLPDLENWLIAWSFFETIHSRSYSYILKNLFSNPSEIFDDITVNEEIIKRAISVSEYYDKLKDLILRYKSGTLQNLIDLKKQIYLTLIAVNALEGVRFYVSFACSFAFAESKKVMEGNAKIIKLIARDEMLHLSGTQHMINLINRGKDDLDLFEYSKTQECKDQIYKIYTDVVNQEKEWSKYLFKDGSILGLNELILNQYLEYLTDSKLANIGMDPIFDRKSNPLPWMNHWLSNNQQQSAPQETELTSYQTSQINNDEDNFNNITL